MSARGEVNGEGHGSPRTCSCGCGTRIGRYAVAWASGHNPSGWTQTGRGTHDFLGVPCYYRLQVARILGVVPRTVNLLGYRGQLHPLRSVVGVWNHWPADEVHEFARTYRKWRRAS